MKWFRRSRFEREMDTELRAHLEAYTEDLVRSGIERAEAERRARVEFGSLAAVKDECRQAQGWQAIDDLRADLRYSYGSLLRQPGFAAVAILSLALGIGANTAILGLVDAVMLRELPVRDAGSLVFVHTAGSAGRDGPPYPCFELLRDHTGSFQSMAAFSPSSMELSVDGSREMARGVWVSANFYELLGVTPLLGRTLAASDGRGVEGAAVISRAYWQTRFGGDPAILGRRLRLFDRSMAIVGVLAGEAMSPEPGRPIDIAVPLAFSDPAKMRDRNALWITVIARLKPGAAMEQARAEANGLFRAYMTDLHVTPELRRRLLDHIELSPAARGLGGLRSQFSQPLLAMSVLSGLVLLAACVNVANLMLARATARQREFAVRLAIGAGRGRLIRHTLTEALVLAGAGATLGILVAVQGQRVLAAFFANGRMPIVLDLSMNVRMAALTIGVALMTSVACGILPALRAAGTDTAGGLRIGSRSVAGSRASLRLGRALVVLQVALSMVMLAGAGLFVHSLHELQSVDLGFVAEGILTLEVTPEQRLFGTAEWSAAQGEILEGVRRIPGVRSASWATVSPMSGRDRGAMIEVPGFVPASDTDKELHLAAVSPDHFSTLGIPLLLGRSFTERDNASSSPRVAILNETATRFYFGGASPIGRQVRFANYPRTDLIYQVIGVVKDSKHDSLREARSRVIYLPVAQHVDRVNRLTLAVRCAGDPAAYAAAVRREIRNVRSTMLVQNVSTMERQVQFSLRRERLVAALSSVFGVLALALACIGLYGILAYAVSQRTNEIEIRMALGATRAVTMRMILGEALVLAAVGMAVALPAVWWVGRMSRSLLYGVDAFDVPVFAAALAVMVVCAALAGVVPARRAGRLDPMQALRAE